MNLITIILLNLTENCTSLEQKKEIIKLAFKIEQVCKTWRDGVCDYFKFLIDQFQFPRKTLLLPNANQKSEWKKMYLEETGIFNLEKFNNDLEKLKKKHNEYNLLSLEEFIDDKEIIHEIKFKAQQKQEYEDFFQIREEPSKNFTNFANFPAHPNEKKEFNLPLEFDIISTSKSILLFLQTVLIHPIMNRFKNIRYMPCAVDRYVKFLKLKKKYQNQLLIPTLEIEFVWLSHILRQTCYYPDCKNRYGQIFDHNILLTPYQIKNKERAIKETKRLWKIEYGELYFTPESLLKNDSIPFQLFNWIPAASPLTKIEIVEEISLNNSNNNFQKLNNSLNNNNLQNLNNSGNSNFKRPYNPISVSYLELVRDHKWIRGYVDHTYAFIYEGFTIEKLCKRLLKTYERFLFMSAKCLAVDKDCLLAPNVILDLLWHAHQSNSLLYLRDTTKWIGHPLYHYPWANMSRTSEENRKTSSFYEKTQEMYEKEFNQDFYMEQYFKSFDEE